MALIRAVKRWCAPALAVVVVWWGGLACWGDRGALSCSPCAIALDTVVVLNDGDVTVGFSQGVRVARSRATGRFAVVPISGEGVVALFDSVGRFITEFGRRGEGPGEYTGISGILFDESDSLYVVSASNGRIDVYSPDMTLRRSFPIRGVVRQAILLRNGQFVLQGVRRTDRVADAPQERAAQLELFRARTVPSSGGDATPIAPFQAPPDTSHVGFSHFPLATSGPDRFWLVSAQEHTFEEYDSSGRLLRRFAVQPEWLRPTEMDDEMRGFMDPQPAVESVGVHSSGRIMLLNMIPVMPEAIPEIERGQQPSIDFISSFADHVLEVVDPEAGETIWERRFDYLHLDFLGDDYVYFTRQEARGDIDVVIARVRLR